MNKGSYLLSYYCDNKLVRDIIIYNINRIEKSEEDRIKSMFFICGLYDYCVENIKDFENDIIKSKLNEEYEIKTIYKDKYVYISLENEIDNNVEYMKGYIIGNNILLYNNIEECYKLMDTKDKKICFFMGIFKKYDIFKEEYYKEIIEKIKMGIVPTNN